MHCIAFSAFKRYFWNFNKIKVIYRNWIDDPQKTSIEPAIAVRLIAKTQSMNFIHIKTSKNNSHSLICQISHHRISSLDALIPANFRVKILRNWNHREEKRRQSWKELFRAELIITEGHSASWNSSQKVHSHCELHWHLVRLAIARIMTTLEWSRALTDQFPACVSLEDKWNRVLTLHPDCLDLKKIWSRIN